MPTQQFTKYHGAGNDFVILDGRTLTDALTTEQIAWLCDRHFGIGADGLIVVTPESGNVDYRMIYYNADGKESSMCGNGARCAFAYAHGLGLASDQSTFMAFDGMHSAEFTEDGLVRISMRDISEVRRVSKFSYVLNSGSPHYVRFVEDIDALDAFAEGRAVRNSPDFIAEGINVNFVRTRGPGQLRIRTYERGVEDLTLACGTGVTAAAIAYADQQGLQQGTVSVMADGGDLSVSFHRKDGHYADIFLTGPVTLVYSGGISF